MGAFFLVPTSRRVRTLQREALRSYRGERSEPTSGPRSGRYPTSVARTGRPQGAPSCRGRSRPSMAFAALVHPAHRARFSLFSRRPRSRFRLNGACSKVDTARRQQRMICGERCSGFRLQGLEHGDAIYPGCGSYFANSTSSNDIGNGRLEHDFVSSEQRFVNVRGGIGRIPEVFIQTLLHVPWRCRFQFLNHRFVLGSLSAFLWQVPWPAFGRSYQNHRATAQWLRRY